MIQRLFPIQDILVPLILKIIVLGASMEIPVTVDVPRYPLRQQVVRILILIVCIP